MRGRHTIVLQLPATQLRKPPCRLRQKPLRSTLPRSHGVLRPEAADLVLCVARHGPALLGHLCRWAFGGGEFFQTRFKDAQLPAPDSVHKSPAGACAY